MALVIAELARVTKPGGKVIMVNDNVQYNGEEVPVDLILSDIAEKMRIRVRRDRRAASRQGQRQSADGQIWQTRTAQMRLPMAHDMTESARTQDAISRALRIAKRIAMEDDLRVREKIENLQLVINYQDLQSLCIAEDAWNSVAKAGIAPKMASPIRIFSSLSQMLRFITVASHCYHASA